MPDKIPAAAEPITPDALRGGGRALWDEVLELEPSMTEYRKRILIEACRIADRLDAIDAGLGDDYAVLEMIEQTDHDGNITSYVVAVEKALTTAKGLAEQMSKLIATLRLPGPDGKKQPYQGGSKPGVSRGSYGTQRSNVSSIDHARGA